MLLMDPLPLALLPPGLLLRPACLPACRAAAARVLEPAAGHPVQRLRADRGGAIPLCLPPLRELQLLQHPHRLSHDLFPIFCLYMSAFWLSV